MASTSPIRCVGAAHWDIIGRSRMTLDVGDDTPGAIERRLGGVALNIALALTAHGRRVSLYSAVGDDPAGAELIREIEASGVDCADILRIEGAATGCYVAIEDNRGDLFAAIADMALLETEAPAVTRRAASALQANETVLVEANLDAPWLRQISEAARAVGAEIVANPVSPAKAPRLDFLLSSDLAPTIVANLAEANVLLHAAFDDAADAAAALQARSAGTALVTNGARALALATPDAVVAATPPAAPEGASVTGAGDALLAMFLASHDRRDTPRAALRRALGAAADHMSKRR